VRLGDPGKLYAPHTAIWTNDRTYLEPYLFYVSAETEARLDPEHLTIADLVIEFISPGSAIYYRNTKADTYAALGVKELWLVDETEETVEVRKLEGSRYGDGTVISRSARLTSAVISGLRIDVKRIFAD